MGFRERFNATQRALVPKASINSSFVLQRIQVFAGKKIDPYSDSEVTELLRDKFNTRLPQRGSFEASLEAVQSDHEIIGLIIKYRLSNDQNQGLVTDLASYRCQM